MTIFNISWIILNTGNVDIAEVYDNEWEWYWKVVDGQNGGVVKCSIIWNLG